MLKENFVASTEWNWTWNVESYFNDVSSDTVLSKFHQKAYGTFPNLTVSEKPEQILIVHKDQARGQLLSINQ